MSTRRGDGWQCDHGAQYFTARHAAFRAEVARWQAAGVAAAWQPHIAVLGGLGDHQPDAALERFVGTPRMTAPARFLADALDLQLQATVKGLVRERQFWQLASAESGVLPACFDAVLLAVPAPQAVPLLQPVAGALAQLAAQVVMRGSWALMVRFDERPAFAAEAAFVNRGPLRWIARNNSKPGREGAETWLLHATAEWSEAHIEDSPESVAAALLAAFAELGGPPPAAWVAHRWRYADLAPTPDPALDPEPEPACECIWENGLRLGLCGDWLNGGKVEGAWLSGRALGQRVAASLTGH